MRNQQNSRAIEQTNAFCTKNDCMGTPNYIYIHALHKVKIISPAVSLDNFNEKVNVSAY